MRLYKKMKRTTRQYIVVAFICILVIGGAAVITSFIITNQIRYEYETLLTEANDKLEANQRDVFVAIQDIKVGEEITKEKLERRMAFSSQPNEYYLREEELGKLALIDIPAQTYIMNTMVTDHTVAPELRETEYNVIYISGNISSSDTVDVRLYFPNGEDYLILTKKLIRSIGEDDQRIYFWLSEEEILRMSSAIVDTYLYSGAKIYTTKYIEPNLQEASIVTYEPSISTLLLIQSDPNIIKTATNELSKQVRKALENRLADSMNIEVESIEWELSPNAALTPENKYIEEQETAPVLNDTTSYFEEVQEREAELDYGP